MIFQRHLVFVWKRIPLLQPAENRILYHSAARSAPQQDTIRPLPDPLDKCTIHKEVNCHLIGTTITKIKIAWGGTKALTVLDRFDREGLSHYQQSTVLALVCKF